MLRQLLSRINRPSRPAVRRRTTAANHSQVCEALESRLLPSANIPVENIVAEPAIEPAAAKPHSTTSPTGMTPDQIRIAYGFNSITFADGTIEGDGAGTTIAIVDAYDHPYIANDLHQFNLQFGLPDSGFTKVNQNGGSTMPRPNSGWAMEIALDVQWAHAIAPKANILLVEAFDASLTNLMAAVDYARKAPGVVAVSMSWGAREFLSEKKYDTFFTTPAGHGGVTFLAASGDRGAPAGFPAVSPNVVSVGGTNLTVTTSGTYISETGWSGSGGGISAYQPQPVYQTGVLTQSTIKRTTPDVAYDSDPKSGFAVYNSFSNPSSKPWSQVGGTSAAAPQWAGLIAIADQGRALAGLDSLDGITQTLPKLYSLPSTDFHDVTTGSSTGRPNYSAQTGYDLVTGRGTPIANLVVHDLVGTPTPGVTHFSIATSSSITAGSPFSITVSALDASNNVITDYAGTLHFLSTDVTGILPTDFTFTAADNGTHTFSGLILKAAGERSISVIDTTNSSFVGSVAITVAPAAASRLAFGQQPVKTGKGVVVSPAVTVQIFDAYNNVLTNDSSGVINVAIGKNPGGGVLSGTLSATVSGGIATFTSLSISKLGNGYTLVATSSGLSPVTSSSFNVANSSRAIETFESGSLSKYTRVGGTSTSAGISAFVKHNGFYGLLDKSGTDWIYRKDSAARVKQGDTISVWMTFVNGATGTAAFGFGASSSGTLSLVASATGNQLLLVNNAGYGPITLGESNQTWQTNHWYRLEVSWSTTGAIVGKVFDSDGITLLQSVSGSTNAIKSGGIAFQANGGTVAWDTVEVTSDVNVLAKPANVSGGTNRFKGNGGGVRVSDSSTTFRMSQEAGSPQALLPAGISDTWLDEAFRNFAEIANHLDRQDTFRATGEAKAAKKRSTNSSTIASLRCELPMSKSR